MAILVTGSTGVVGKQVLEHLSGSGAQVRALTRTPEKAHFPDSVTAVQGDLSDVDGLRRAMNGVSTLFLLAPNAPDELTQALQTLSVAREADVKGVVYLSVFKGAEYVDVPHFTGKHTVERMIDGLNRATDHHDVLVGKLAHADADHAAMLRVDHGCLVQYRRAPEAVRG